MRRIGILLLLTLIAPPALGAKGKFKDDQMIRDLASLYWEAWNKHDTKAMVTGFRDDAIFVNPMGRTAGSRSAIEKLFAEEHSTYLKGAKAQAGAVTIQFVGRNVAVIDQEVDMTGVTGVAIKEDEPFRPHFSGVITKKAGKWQLAAARTYVFLPPIELPPAKKENP